jgi:hypothetical protein
MFNLAGRVFGVLLVVAAGMPAASAAFVAPVSAISTAWSQVGGDIDGEAAEDRSGWKISMSSDGSRVAISAPFNDGGGNNSGHVRVYQLVDNTWVKLGDDINGEGAGEFSGISVSLSSDGSRVAIGVEDNGGGTYFGHVRVYSWDGTAWVKLGGDIDGEAIGDFSGISVSLSSDGSRVAIGAPGHDGISGSGFDWGHVRVYSWDGTAWVQLGGDIDGEANRDFSGWSVSLSSDGSRVAIGAPYNDGGRNNSGHVRVYSWNGTAWVQLGGDIDGEAAEDQSGWSVSLSSDGSRVAIGAPFNDGGGNDSGHVRVYQLVDNTWVKLGGDIDGEAAGDESGYSVSLSNDGTRVAIGARYNDGNGRSSGHVRVYSWDGTAWVKLGADIDGVAAEDLSGYSVSLSSDGSRVAIGAPYDDGGGNNSGHVRVFDNVQLVVTPAPAPEVPAVVTPAPAPEVPAVVTPNPTTALAALTNAPSPLKYRAANKRVTLRWRAVEGATSYVVTTTRGTQRCETTATSCVISRLRNGKAYTYRVYSVNADGVRSATSTRVSARPGFQVKRTTLKAKRSLKLSSIVTTPSKGKKTWRVTSGRCRIQGTRLIAPPTKGTCKLRLATAKRGSYPAMSSTIRISITR